MCCYNNITPYYLETCVVISSVNYLEVCSIIDVIDTAHDDVRPCHLTVR